MPALSPLIGSCVDTRSLIGWCWTWGLWWGVGSWVYHVSTYIYYHLLFLSQFKHSIWLAAFTDPILMTTWQNTPQPKTQTNKLIKNIPHLYWQIDFASGRTLNAWPRGVREKGRGYKNIPLRQSSWPLLCELKSIGFRHQGHKKWQVQEKSAPAQPVFLETFAHAANISRAEGKSDEYLVLQRVQRSLRESFFILMNGTLFVLSSVWSVLSESGNYFLMGSFTVSNHMWLCFTQLVQSKIVNQRARFNCLNYLIIRL